MREADAKLYERFQRMWGHLGPTSANTVRLAIDAHHDLGLCTAQERLALMRLCNVRVHLPRVHCDECRAASGLFNLFSTIG